MDLLFKVQAAGIVGLGGAGFPTHVKLKGSFEYFIINAAECEPMLRTDRFVMLNFAEDIIRTAQLIGDELGIPDIVIALKAHYHDEIRSLQSAIDSLGSRVRLHTLQNFYPAGDEQTMVCEVTGRVVPPAGLPSAVGAVVDNVSTVYAISQALEGVPLTDKYLTVTGEVNHPVIVKAPVGTSFEECIKLAGGAKTQNYYLINGGPMMGKPVSGNDSGQNFVTKTCSGILVLPGNGYHASKAEVSMEWMLHQARSACIQCSFCTQLCPRHLLGHPLNPHKIMRKMAAGGDPKEMLDDPDIRNAALCCECGICEVYACPMGLMPRTINSMLKQELGKAGIRYSAEKGRIWEESADRTDRKAPSERVAAKLGVSGYYHLEIKELREAHPDRVEIPLRMHIGVPAEPVVSAGQAVKKGDLIARPPEGKLGACIHASIDGKVTAVSDRIIIEREA